MSKLEQKLLFQIRAMGLPEPDREFRAIEGRKFRFDFAWLEQKLLVECQGGIWTRGAHGRPVGIKRDMEKLNLAQLQGWRVMQFGVDEIDNGEAVGMITKALGVEND
jgi:very-short-patch-repair endonuclease